MLCFRRPSLTRLIVCCCCSNIAVAAMKQQQQHSVMSKLLALQTALITRNDLIVPEFRIDILLDERITKQHQQAAATAYERSITARLWIDKGDSTWVKFPMSGVQLEIGALNPSELTRNARATFLFLEGSVDLATNKYRRDYVGLPCQFVWDEVVALRDESLLKLHATIAGEQRVFPPFWLELFDSKGKALYQRCVDLSREVRVTERLAGPIRCDDGWQCFKMWVPWDVLQPCPIDLVYGIEKNFL